NPRTMIGGAKLSVLCEGAGFIEFSHDCEDPMQLRKWILCLLFLGAAFMMLTVQVEAQVAPRFSIGSSPSPEVSLSVFSGDAFPIFNELFDLAPETRDLRPVSFVAVNRSNKAIIGISVDWLLTDQTGKTTSPNTRSHSFLAPDFAPLAAPRESLLVLPGMFVQESPMRGRGKVVTHPSSRTVALFSSSVQVHAEIDAIIFSDGEIVGPNRSKLHAEIQDRKT